MDKFYEGELIIYQNGASFEIGKVKEVVEDGAFVYYSSGETAAKTPFDKMHKLINSYVITSTMLGVKAQFPTEPPFNWTGELPTK